MDTWTLHEKYKSQQKEIKKLETRIKYMEGYLSTLTKGNKKDEKLRDKKIGSPSVRTRGQDTKKPKGN